MIVRSETLTIERHDMGSVAHLYPSLVREVIGTVNYIHNPEFVYLGRMGDEIVGYCSVYPYTFAHVYLCSAGVIPSQRGVKTLHWFLKALNELHKDWRIVTTDVDRNNLPALRMALKAGFIPSGMHVATDGTVMLELMREAIHVNL